MPSVNQTLEGNLAELQRISRCIASSASSRGHIAALPYVE